MKTLVIAAAASLALALNVAPTFAASNSSGHGNAGRTEAAANQSNNRSCADILADQSEYSHADVRACE